MAVGALGVVQERHPAALDHLHMLAVTKDRSTTTNTPATSTLSHRLQQNLLQATRVTAGGLKRRPCDCPSDLLRLCPDQSRLHTLRINPANCFNSSTTGSARQNRGRKRHLGMNVARSPNSVASLKECVGAGWSRRRNPPFRLSITADHDPPYVLNKGRLSAGSTLWSARHDL
jgi:hypothetical protein